MPFDITVPYQRDLVFSDHNRLCAALLDVGFDEQAEAIRGIQAAVPDRHVASYGASGNGVSDDLANLQLAINGGGALCFGAVKTYRITAPLTVSSDIDIDLNGATIDARGIPSATALSQRGAFIVQPPASASVTALCTADVAEGDAIIAVTSSAGIAAGDWVKLSSNEYFMDGVTSGAKRGYIARVRSVPSATSLILHRPAPTSFAVSGGAQVTLLSMLSGVSIRNGRLLLGGVGSGHSGVIAKRCVDVLVEGLTIDDAEDCGVSLDDCVGGIVRGNRVAGCTSSATIGNTGYGVALYSTSNALVEGNRFERCRHSVAGGGRTPSYGCNIVNNSATSGGIGTVDFDCHEATFDWLFQGNESQGSGGYAAAQPGAEYGGFVIRGQRTSVIANRIFYAGSRAILVKSYVATPTGLNGTLVKDNLLVGCNHGIVLDGDLARVRDTIISGNRIFGNWFSAIFVTKATGVTMDGNVISDVNATTGNDSNGIHIKGAAGDPVAGVTISGGRISGLARRAVKAEHVTDLVIDGVSLDHMAAAYNDALLLQNCDGVSVQGCRGAVTCTFIGADTVERLSVTHNAMAFAVGAAALQGDFLRAYRSDAAGPSQHVLINNNVATGDYRLGAYVTHSDHVFFDGNDFAAAASNPDINVVGATEFTRWNTSTSGGATYTKTVSGNYAAFALLAEGMAAVSPPEGVYNSINAQAGYNGFLADWRVNGVPMFQVSAGGTVYAGTVVNPANFRNSRILFAAAGVTLARDIADANPAVTSFQENAGSTGDIHRFRDSAGLAAAIRKTGALFQRNVSAPPSTDASGGTVYVEAGSLKFRGGSGTVTTLAVA
jgi:hypothetical protein